MEINRQMKRKLKDKRIQKIKAEAEAKIGRSITDEEFMSGLYLALQQAERRKKKYV